MQCVECNILEFVATNVGPVMICQELLVHDITLHCFAKIAAMLRKNGKKLKM